MKTTQTKIGLTLFILGLLGVFSLLVSDLASAFPDWILKELEGKMSPEMLKYALLINPAILLIVMTLLGTLFYKKAGYNLPVFESLFGAPIKRSDTNITLTTGAGLGILTGALLLLISKFFMPYLPSEFIEISAELKLHWLSRFGYGGITEEIIVRFGAMTILTLLFIKLLGKRKTSYWLANVGAALLFGLGHLPFTFMLVPDAGTMLIAYILIGNAVAGLVFGWLYWKKGLASAMIAHMAAHVAMMCFGG